VTPITITALSGHFENQYSPEWSIVLGPFGALVTLQFSLTTALASQPHNIIIGLRVALTVSLAVSYAEGVEVYIQQAILAIPYL
jgi:CBS-domain-containing membrane protein